jgi:hypothetical protein
MKDLTPAFLSDRPWLVWWLVIVVSTAATGMGTWISKSSAGEAATLRLDLDRLPSTPVSKPTAAAAPDLATQLGTMRSSARFMAELQRASTSAGASLTSVSINESAATADALGRQEFNVNLRGGYAPTKRVLAEVLGRFSAASVPVLRMRRDANSGLIDTTVVFSIWSAPLPSPVSGGT